MSKSKSPADFNDLHKLRGLDVVREQVLAAFEVAPVSAGEEPPLLDAMPPEYDGLDSPVPSVPAEVPRESLDDLLERYALAMPDAKVWDIKQQKLLKQRAAKAAWGTKLFVEWLDHDRRRTVDEDVVAPLEAAAQKRGSGGLAEALRRYVYLYPSDTVWDRDKRMVVAIKDLKHAIAAFFPFWIAHPNRDQIDIDCLVFDPTQQVDPDTHINMFRGLPLTPDENGVDQGKCDHIYGLIVSLCNGDAEVISWLIKWLAYPLQHVGAKMDTAVMMHSDKQGSGKSLLFGGVMRKIYGEYGATLGQHQLESQYTDWRSNMLFGLFEEVLGRDQKYSHTGTIKHMITGETHRIEKKFVSGWEEANHMNAVFLSNELQPFPIEESDRRMMVIWPERTLPEDEQKAIAAELDSGGIEAFYHFLLSYPLSDFDPHTKPIMTAAKESLIDFGRAGWDAFHREWKNGSLPWEIPYANCLASDLYKVFRVWCSRGHENAMSQRKFGEFLSKRETRWKDKPYVIGNNAKKKGTFYIVERMPEDGQQQHWLGGCVEEFQKAMAGELPNMGDSDG